MAKENPLKPPKSGGKPKRITANAAPGGSQTPGAKAIVRDNEARLVKAVKAGKK